MYSRGRFSLRKIGILFLAAVSASLLFMGSSMPIVIQNERTEGPSISAKSAIVMEVKTGAVVYEKNAYQFLPMASTTKIMTTILALESGGLDETFVVDSEAIKVEGSSMGLQEGDTVTKRALAIGMLLPSGNDAANAAAVRIAGSIPAFAELMNEKASQIGLTNTRFVTPSGLHDDAHGSTAYDMALLARYAAGIPDFMEICSKQTAQLSFGNPPYSRSLKNTNKLLKQYPEAIGMKTGFTDEAGRCLVSVAQRDGVQLICVTLKDPNDWEDHKALLNYGFSQLYLYNLKLPAIPKASVVGGESVSVALEPDRTPEKVALLQDELGKLEGKVYLPRFQYAPIVKGDLLGRVDYTYEGRLMESIPLRAAEGVGALEEKKSWFGQIMDWFKK